MRTKRFRTIVAVILLAVFAGAGCSSAPPKTHSMDNPLYGQELYSGQAIHAITAEHDLRASGNTARADEISKLAAQPTATWLSGGPDAEYDHVLIQQVLADAGHNQMPVFVLYNLPHRDAGEQFSRGGASGAAAYRSWVRSITAELGKKRAIFIIEPDGVAAIARGHLHDENANDERLELIRSTVAALKAHANIHAYIDAGNSGWTKPDEMAGLLKRAGVDMADGIAVNVSNFYTDAESASYGQKLSQLLGGIGVVVDRSRNGNGPEQPQNALSWCNPPGRAIGQVPAIGGKTDTIQAWLWIKPPGDSDGSCRPGEPPAGQWWLDYALGLVEGR